MNENEIWKDIDGYEGLYQISNYGQVKSLKDNHGNPREKILKFGKDRYGYLFVNLYIQGKKKFFLIHKLVSNAFIPNPNNLKCVNHKDENKENNVVDNLEWCTHQYNINYGTCIQRRVANTDWAKKVANTDWAKKVANTDYKLIAEKQSKRVYQYKKNGELVAIWQSTKECGRNGYNFGHVAECCRGERKSHRGYIWSYNEL